MSWRVRYTRTARADLLLLGQDVAAAERALRVIDKGVELLQAFPFTCRKADRGNPFLRELLVSFGASGYVALFEIEPDHTATILAVRHQREDDYH
ncbi:MAG: type II toxin-antitoxin system RelE/ParE family toxin [Metallibacterium sp.]